MKISKIEVINFRLLNDFILTPEDELSLIIGKNNKHGNEGWHKQ